MKKTENKLAAFLAQLGVTSTGFLQLQQEGAVLMVRTTKEGAWRFIWAATFEEINVPADFDERKTVLVHLHREGVPQLRLAELAGLSQPRVNAILKSAGEL